MSQDPKPHYTVFVRLPFPRVDFVDPPLVDWDAAKDKELWSTISRNPKGTELNWKELAAKFSVPVPFLLQQSAWLYEHQLSTVRAQMRQISGSRPTSLVGGADVSQALQEYSQQRVSASPQSGSGSGSCSGSSVTQPTMRGSMPGSGRPSFTHTQSRLSQVRTAVNIIPEIDPQHGSSSSVSPTAPAATQLTEPAKSTLPSIEDTTVSSAQSSSDEELSDSDRKARRMPMRKSKLFRPAHVVSPQSSRSGASSPTFLPFGGSSRELLDNENHDDELHKPAEPSEDLDLVDTLRSPQRLKRYSGGQASTVAAGHKDLALQARADVINDGSGVVDRIPKGYDQHGVVSGSSISDLDDASLTQSALEEALASHLRRDSSSVSVNSPAE